MQAAYSELLMMEGGEINIEQSFYRVIKSLEK